MELDSIAVTQDEVTDRGIAMGLYCVVSGKSILGIKGVKTEPK